MSKPIVIDGGAGGGQMLRSALSLSMVTDQSFRMINIRGKRQRPGLMRQHLACVRAAVEISGGCADGAEPGSTEIVFKPETIRSGDYTFAIGTAGSTHLLLQTLLPAFWGARVSARLRIEGGTHNPLAPPAGFIDRVWRPLLAGMGADFTYKLVETGFAPAGGGAIEVEVPTIDGLRPMSLHTRGEALEKSVVVRHRGLTKDIADRMGEAAARQLDWIEHTVVNLPQGPGQGIVCEVYSRFTEVSELITTFGEMGVSAERIGNRAAKAMADYLGSGAAVGRNLADQLLLPMALAGGGEFTTMNPSDHFATNAEVIGKFLSTRVTCKRQENGPCVVNVSASE